MKCVGVCGRVRSVWGFEEVWGCGGVCGGVEEVWGCGGVCGGVRRCGGVEECVGV